MHDEFEEIPARPETTSDGILSLLSAIIDSSDDAIVSKTLDGTISSWNRAAEKMFGYTAAEAIGRNIRLIIPSERLSEEDEVLRRIRRGEKVDHFETVRQAKDGHRLDISVTISPVKDRFGRIIGASKVARDITERKRAEREREELLAREQASRSEAQKATNLLQEQVELLRKEIMAREKAQADLAEALASRDEFIAVAAHELRNPLNVLGLTFQLLRRASANTSGAAQTQALVDKLRVQLDRLNALVERLLDVTRIRAGKFELFREVFDMRPLITEVAARFSDQAYRITTNVQTMGAIEGYWDRLRIDQALTNLLSNAINYGLQKPISIEALVDNDQVVIRVQDHGIGMAPGDLERIFERFQQSSVRTGYKGLGLGLWITKRIVEAHGGTIVAESEIDRGSMFTVRLPLRAM
jgi:PAS domain S-box-containing protein